MSKENKIDWEGLRREAEYLADECSRLEHQDIPNELRTKGIRKIEETRLKDARRLVEQAMEKLGEAQELLDPDWFKNNGWVIPDPADSLAASDLLRGMLRCDHLRGCSCHELRPITEQICDREWVDESQLIQWRKVRAK